jgi:hypothetical protein
VKQRWESLHADELIQIMRLMDGSNRYRFSGDPDSLAEWESARSTFAPSRSTGGPSSTPSQPQGGEIKLAA